MSHMTQTANPVTLLASPLGEEGHEVAKGWTVVILIMILDVDVTAEGGIIKLYATSRGNERYEGKKQRVIYFTYHFGVFPLWWLSPLPCLVGSMSYDTESKSRNADFISIAAERQSATLRTL